MQEIKSDERPYLRPIKAEGCYDDLSHYLDVQFRLLKEDLVYPLREGIRERLSGFLLREKKHDLQVFLAIFEISKIRFFAFTLTQLKHCSGLVILVFLFY